MWRDIGLGDWLFDLDKAEDRVRVSGTVLAMARDFEKAKAKTELARKFVLKRQQETMRVLHEHFA
jgi:hypothetical protein